jgi:hypothetical protein
MPTKEEIEAAEKAAKEAEEKKAADEADAKKKADEAAAKKAEQDREDFETWLSKQPADVQEKYKNHVGGLKSALDKEREANKASKGALDKLAKYEQEAEEKRKASMTEVERLKAEKAEAEAKVKAVELSQLRRDAADKAGLPLEFADRLKGETPEELDADAAKVKELVPTPDVKKKQESIHNKAPGPDGLPAGMTPEQMSEFLWGRQK